MHLTVPLRRKRQTQREPIPLYLGKPFFWLCKDRRRLGKCAGVAPGSLMVIDEK